MPSGIVKTPSSARTKDATVTTVAKSAEKTASGGKKFVQTRLPFKLITPGGGGGGVGGGTGATASPSASTSASGPSATVILDDDEDTDPAPRKRKLSYGDESPLEGTGCSADSKENLDVGSTIATKKVKTAPAAMDVDSLAENVIELIDDDDEAMAEEHDQQAVKEKEKETRPKPRKSEAKKASTTPIQIKLPLVGKRPKRRKSLKKSEDCEDTPAKDAGKTGSESSDDIEVISEELNPQKKLKVQETVAGAVAVAVDQSPEKSPEVKKQEKPKEASKESKEEPHKKNDQSTIDLFMAKKVESGKKEKPELKTTEKSKKKDQPRSEDAKAKEATKKDTTKVLGKSKKEGNNKKEDVEASTAELQKEQEDAAAKTQKEETNKKNVQITQKKELVKKPQAQAVEKEKTQKEEPSVPEKPKTVESSPREKPDKESSIAADISVILSSSEDNSSSSDHEMDVDTDVQKDGLLHRKSLQETSSNAQKTLTPKQQRLMERRKKAREEKEQKLAEERRLKQQEKEEREQQRKQERDEKEQQRKLEKDQKEQLRRTEKEEKERKRQAEVDSKNEEKRKRNEAKEEVQRKRDEERRKKEQEREEAAQKKKRAAESFSKFFVPKQPKAGGAGSTHNTSCLEHEQSSCDSSKVSSQTLAFRPFQIKDDMLLAPIVRGSLAQKQRSQLDTLFRHRNEDDDDDDDEEEEEEEDFGRRRPLNRAHLYLSELSSGRRQPLKMLRDARLQRRTKDEEEEDEVQVIDDLSNAGLPIEEEQPKQLARMRAKYLQFADNRRPAYYGTWRKKSTTISARRPLAQDKLHFDYELDSDCEWEEEEPGESLSASEDEKERESEEESEEEYNEWYVPHGHLSDEELQNDGDEGAMDDGHTREAQKAKLQVLQQEFAQEMKKQTKKMKSRLLGPVWLDENGNKSQLFPAIFAHTIDMYACWQLEPLSLEPPVEQEREDQVPEQPAPLQLDNRHMHQLVRLTHGNRNSKAFLINEYLEYLKTQTPNQTLLPSKAVLREKFDELASWKTVELGTPTELVASGSGTAGGNTAKKTKKPKKRLCWVVPPELLEKFQLPELPLQNQWDYTLTPKVNEGTDTPQHEQSPPAEAETSARPSNASSAPTTPSTGQATTPSSQGAKKRATLIMSVPRDQPIHAATKNHLISQFLRRQSESATSSPRDKPQNKSKDVKDEKREKQPPTVSEDVVLLSD
ncbi:chromatin assembly factor 1 subunit A [Drosophila elegans]|uniref:chromatin assembly factor 1 subunit A n=1 Tax=Drosophila elegans TaxID=30023 RepID=UPI0007E894D1|nr:chromatin assembly factor 1 subunit A [Drosophila elegans]